MRMVTDFAHDTDYFVKGYRLDYPAMQTILFLAGHPYAKFDELAITQTVSPGGGPSIRHTLEGLAAIGIIKTWTVGERTLYSLTDERRSWALEMLGNETGQPGAARRERILQSLACAAAR